MKIHIPLSVLAAVMLATVATPTAQAEENTWSSVRPFKVSNTHFNDLTNQEKQKAEKLYKVDTLYQISTRNKPLFTEYYVTRPDQYGAYPSSRRYIVDPDHLSKKSGYKQDQRRYPVTILPDLRKGGTYYPTGIGPSSIPKYNYYNKPIRASERNNAPITLYNNFTAYPLYNSRW